MKLWKTTTKRAAMTLFAAAVIVPAAQAIPPDDNPVSTSTQVTQQQSNRPDDRAGIHGIEVASSATTVTAPSVIRRHEALAKLDDRPAASYYTPESLNAMSQRYQGQAEMLGLAGHSPSPQQVLDLVQQTSPSQVGLAEQYLRDSGQLAPSAGQRPDDRSGVRGPGPISADAPTVGTGFDWSDAGIGAVSAFGASLLLAGLMLLALHTTQRRRGRIAAQ
jgi:hypothetical protein